MKNQRRGFDRYNVFRGSWRSLECQTTPLKILSKRESPVEPRWAKKQTKKLRPQPTKQIALSHRV